MDAQTEAPEEDLGDLLLEVLPGDGSTMGNQAAREALSQAAGRQISEEAYGAVRERLVGLGLIFLKYISDTFAEHQRKWPRFRRKTSPWNSCSAC